MDLSSILGLVKELAVLLAVFGAMLAYSIVRGQRALTSLILGLYVAFLISLQFPYYDALFAKIDFASDAIISLVLFALFTAGASFLFERLLTHLLGETLFEGIGKKAFLAVLATVLIMIYFYHVLPVTGIIDPGAKLAAIFGPQQYFFWWLLLPLIGLMFI